MTTTIPNKHDQPQQTSVESETKNSSSTITATDIIGLSWIFNDEDILGEFK